MSGGRINIDRGLFSHPMFKAEPFTQREAFIWILMEASWKAREKRVGSTIASLERGQLAASIRFMGEAWGWDKARVSRFLNMLKKRDTITIKTETGCSIITVCNYDQYQGQPSDSETATRQQPRQQRDSSETAARQTRIPYVIPEGISDGIRDENSSPDDDQQGQGDLGLDDDVKPNSPKPKERKKARTQVPEKWKVTPKLIEWGKEIGKDAASLEAMAPNFVDFHRGKGNLFSDVEAAFRTWVRNQIKFSERDRAARGGSGPAQGNVSGILRRIESRGATS